MEPLGNSPLFEWLGMGEEATAKRAAVALACSIEHACAVLSAANDMTPRQMTFVVINHLMTRLASHVDPAERAALARIAQGAIETALDYRHPPKPMVN